MPGGLPNLPKSDGRSLPRPTWIPRLARPCARHSTRSDRGSWWTLRHHTFCLWRSVWWMGMCRENGEESQGDHRAQQRQIPFLLTPYGIHRNGMDQQGVVRLWNERCGLSPVVAGFFPVMALSCEEWSHHDLGTPQFLYASGWFWQTQQHEFLQPLFVRGSGGLDVQLFVGHQKGRDKSRRQAFLLAARGGPYGPSECCRRALRLDVRQNREPMGTERGKYGIFIYHSCQYFCDSRLACKISERCEGGWQEGQSSGHSGKFGQGERAFEDGIRFRVLSDRSRKRIICLKEYDVSALVL